MRVTVGPGVAPGLPFPARGLYRRSGFSPCPEDISFSCSNPYYTHEVEKCKPQFKKQMFDKPLPFFIRVWYYKIQKRMYVLKICSKEMGGLIMANASGTAQKMRRRKENHKFSRMMAVILGLIVTVEVMIAGGMIFNIDFHSADIIAVIMGFIVLYSGVVAVLTDN